MDIQKYRIRRYFIAVFFLAGSTFVWAQAPIVKEQRIFRVDVPQDMEEQLVEVDAPSPGATFEYELTYRNVSGKKLDGIVVRQPVYAGATYVLGSATTPEGTEFHVSVDNGITFHPETSLNAGQLTPGGNGAKSGKVFQALQWAFRRPMKADEVTRVKYRILLE